MYLHCHESPCEKQSLKLPTLFYKAFSEDKAKKTNHMNGSATVQVLVEGSCHYTKLIMDQIPKEDQFEINQPVSGQNQLILVMNLRGLRPSMMR